MDDRAGLVAATLNCEGNEGGFRTESGEHIVIRDADGPEDDLLPAGLDSHRYRCCGNGVSSPVAEWIGRRLLAALAPRTPEVVEPGAFDLGDGDKRGVSA